MQGPGTAMPVLEFAGVLAFALDGALCAVRDRRFDVVGVLTLAVVTALGGGMMRDALLGATPAASLTDWRYLAVALLGGLLAHVAHRTLHRIGGLIRVVDALGLGLFAVTGSSKALAHGLGPLPAVLLGLVTAVGGGVLRDVCLLRVPLVLSRDTQLYAVPAALAAALVALAHEVGWTGAVVPVAAAACAVALRLASVRWNITAPPAEVPALRVRRRPGDERPDERPGRRP